MSCAYNFNDYIPPRPPREWSRVQNSCSLVNDSTSNGLVKLPYSNKLVPSPLVSYNLQMLAKGNILQYKANSGNLTKAQRYSKIAQGQWTNRNTTWASQSTNGITNPNTSSLKRVGTFNIALDPITGQVLGPTLLPVSCPQPINNIYPSIPSTVQSSTSEPPVPPPPPPAPPSGPTVPPVPQQPEPAPIVIQDNGSMVCSIQENICTGEIKRFKANQICNLTTDSDVPGRIEPLCWNDGTPTWYPRQRYTMSNSTNKWPINAKLIANKNINNNNLIGSIYNINYQPTNNGIILFWNNSDENSLHKYKIIIKQNDITINTLYSYINYYTISGLLNCDIYSFYVNIVDTNNNDLSDTISLNNIQILWPGSPSNVSISNISDTLTTLSWNIPITNTCCNNLITNYNVYINNNLVASVNATTYSYTFTNLNIGVSYNLGVSAVSYINNYKCTSSILNKTISLKTSQKAYFYYNNSSLILPSLANTSVIQNISIPSGVNVNNVLVNLSILFDYVSTTHSIQMWGFSLVNSLDNSIIYFQCLSNATNNLTTVNNGYMNTGSVTWCDNIVGLIPDEMYELYIYFDNNDDENVNLTNISLQLLPSTT